MNSSIKPIEQEEYSPEQIRKAAKAMLEHAREIARGNVEFETYEDVFETKKNDIDSMT